MPKRYTIQKAISFSPESSRQIQEAADRFQLSFSEIVRLCCDNDLPKLIDRENARRRRRRDGK